MSGNIYMCRIEKLRNLMKKSGVDVYIIPTDDFHMSEYVGDYFKCREYMSGFTGSAGTLVITGNEACLWTDGRYFIQAESQLDGTGIILKKSGSEGTPTIQEYIKKSVKDGCCIGYDGRTVSAAYADGLKKILAGRNIVFRENIDLVGDIWNDRPQMPSHAIWELAAEYSGESRRSKIERVRKAMKEQGAAVHLITALDDIAWLFNLRGNDIKYCPVPLAYAVIEKNVSLLYVLPGTAGDDIKEKLEKEDICVRPYFDIYNDMEKYGKGDVILLDRNRVNTALAGRIKGPEVINRINPETQMKAVKNPTEIYNMIQAHIKDGVAVTKLIYRIKKSLHGSEIALADELIKLRSREKDYIGESFAPIIAFGEHGAIIHYEATEETDKSIEKDNFLLMDTGGHYLQGTTDITRTVSTGNITEEMKKNYTAVLMGNLNLANLHFRYGTDGSSMDVEARRHLWEMGLDYNHGTGHGVGYLLNVHEGPQSISMRNRKDCIPFEDGMITSDEPGYYKEGDYGIRLENLLLCRNDYTNENGRFMKFEILTMVPFDRESILIELMSDRQLRQLNDYHKKVYDTISPYLDEDEKEWLREETKERLRP